MVQNIDFYLQQSLRNIMSSVIENFEGVLNSHAVDKLFKKDCAREICWEQLSNVLIT